MEKMLLVLLMSTSFILVFIGWIYTFIISYRIHTVCLIANIFCSPFNQLYLIFWHTKKMKPVFILYFSSLFLLAISFIILVAFSENIVSNDKAIQFDLPYFNLKIKKITETNRFFHTYDNYNVEFKEIKLPEIGDKSLSISEIPNCSNIMKDKLSIKQCFSESSSEGRNFVLNTFSYNKIFYKLNVLCRANVSSSECKLKNIDLIDSLKVLQ
ncbi:MAG: hypothetical protein COB02_14730 [Candidatus Cloacimonadota bacterium]|nr:MAG: hypothetical protein COB02_14730 [Candidatus Cloacimonadota bacterium]